VVAASIARQVGFKGLFIDTESYRRATFSYHFYIQKCAEEGQTPRQHVAGI